MKEPLTPQEMAFIRRQATEGEGDGLTPREREILRQRFGVDDEHAMTLSDVARRWGVTRERIRQIEDKAIRKLLGASR